ncbi:hypothetical protein [Guptibacillus spartinae]|uniref:hypothetical protein n=1 Tax=Guptibacillus spartinae TaxID=3025679 RepID=UPI0023613B72|nr:hypothetical protein [Pseudalkalibacillus spartinae]
MLEILFGYLMEFYDFLSNFLEPLISWYGIIIVFSFLYLLVEYILDEYRMKEKEKQKAIVKDMEDVVEKYQDNDKKIKNENNPMISRFMNFTRTYSQLDQEQLSSIRSNGLEFVKKHKGRPWMGLLTLFFKMFIFLSFWWYLMEIKEVNFTYLVPLISASLSFITYMTRKTVMFHILLSLLLFWIYSHLSGAANCFILVIIAWRFFRKKILSNKRKD